MQNPLPPLDTSHVVIDEGLVYWNHSFKTMSKEEAKEQWDKTAKELEEASKEDEWKPP